MKNFEKAIHPLATILSDDPNAVQYMECIYGHLRLPLADLPAVKRKLAIESNSNYIFFGIILSTWHGKHGKRATVKRLYNALKNIKALANCREKIAKRFKLLPQQRKLPYRAAKANAVGFKKPTAKAADQKPAKTVSRKQGIPKPINVKTIPREAHSDDESDGWVTADEPSPNTSATPKVKKLPTSKSNLEPNSKQLGSGCQPPKARKPKAISSPAQDASEKDKDTKDKPKKVAKQRTPTNKPPGPKKLGSNPQLCEPVVAIPVATAAAKKPAPASKKEASVSLAKTKQPEKISKKSASPAEVSGRMLKNDTSARKLTARVSEGGKECKTCVTNTPEGRNKQATGGAEKENAEAGLNRKPATKTKSSKKEENPETPEIKAPKSVNKNSKK